MNQLETEVRAHKDPWSKTVKVAVLAYDYQAKKCYVAELLKMVEFPECTSPKPTFDMTGGQAQRLMDDLWDCGIRPSEGSGSAGQLVSIQAHLKDMQTLTFKLVDELTKPPVTITRVQE